MLNSEGIRQRGFRSAPYQSTQRLNNGGSAPFQPAAQPNVIGQVDNSGPGVNDNQNSNPKTPPPTRGKKKWLIIILIVFVVLAVAAGFFAWKYFSSDEKDSSEETTAQIIEQVGKLFALPEGEEPTVAQIQDKDKLKDQEFFDRANNDDYLLVYEKARIALLYRQTSNKLINVGPVSLGQEGQPEGGPQGQVSGEQTQ